MLIKERKSELGLPPSSILLVQQKKILTFLKSQD